MIFMLRFILLYGFENESINNKNQYENMNINK
jgi:hypothetical protein